MKTAINAFEMPCSRCEGIATCLRSSDSTACVSDGDLYSEVTEGHVVDLGEGCRMANVVADPGAFALITLVVSPVCPAL